MASERRAGVRRALPVLLLALVGCAAETRRFPLRAPLQVDPDTAPFRAECRPDEKHGGLECSPAEYESSFAWDGADNLVFRPLAEAFAVETATESTNVNAFDEVPDSSWFENRLGAHELTPEDVARGFCTGEALDPDAPDGSWVIDQGKMNGANPGFRIEDPTGRRFLLKVDTKEEPERATGATVIAGRLYYSAGWWTPCESIVYVKPSIFALKPGLTVTDNTGIARKLDRKRLGEMLTDASRRGDRIRFIASQWLPGRPIGPFRYEGTRTGDPNDVIPHEDRRDLRGARLVAAWMNHFDSREQNSMDTWMPLDKKDRTSPGYIRHWYLDLGDCFGSRWSWDGISRRLGHAYYFDVGYVTEDFVTLGTITRPWERATAEGTFNYFRARDFDPEAWRGGYPNPAFQRMTERDGAWAARILSHYTPAHVAAAVRTGNYTNPRDTRFLTEQLVLRQRLIVARYLSRVSPLARPRVTPGGELCVTDLALASGVFDRRAFAYAARAYTGASFDDAGALAVRAAGANEVCAPLLHHAKDGGAPPGNPSRYVVVDISNRQARWPLRVHLYDLGPRAGFRVVGLERPETDRVPYVQRTPARWGSP